MNKTAGYDRFMDFGSTSLKFGTLFSDEVKRYPKKKLKEPFLRKMKKRKDRGFEFERN
jgi:hypothetical protein